MKSAPLFEEDADGVTLRVRIQPNAYRDEVVGVVGGSLRIRLTAPPVEGAANKHCIRFLSKILHIAKSRIIILRGERTRDNVIRVNGMSRAVVEKSLLSRRG